MNLRSRSMLSIITLSFLSLTGLFSQAQTITTIAETDDPTGVAVDKLGNVYFTDGHRSYVGKIAPGGSISVVAGMRDQRGFSGDGGLATSAKINFAQGLIVDSSGNIYIADTYNGRVRKVDTRGYISTIAGSGHPNGSPGTPLSGDGGPANKAGLDPYGVAVDASGNVYISDRSAGVIRKVDGRGIISTVAGNGGSGDYNTNHDGPALKAELTRPRGLAFDSSGNLYIADSEISRVRKLAPNGTISTVAGSGYPGYRGDGGPALSAGLWRPLGVAVDSRGNLYILDSPEGARSSRVRKVDNKGTISTVAGNGEVGNGLPGDATAPIGDGGPALNLKLYVSAIAVDSTGNLYLADGFNHRIRKVTGLAP